ncbi:hypothetical protein [Actinomadura sp. BRA 177]|jgi:hypothetical protein|nr:hypothetical protein [Actinomadura sp. BRA 177]
MRIAIAAVVGVLLAAGASFGTVQLVNASQKDPVIKPLYNYGSR